MSLCKVYHFKKKLENKEGCKGVEQLKKKTNLQWPQVEKKQL